MASSDVIKLKPRRRRHLRLIVGGLVVVLIGVGVAWNVAHRGSGLGAEASVTASSTAPGSSPRNVVSSGEADDPGAGWRSASTATGAWLNFRWERPIDVHEVVIVRNPLSEPGVKTGFLTFSDGSQMSVVLSVTGRTTRVPITPRLVDNLRFTTTTVDEGSAAVVDEVVVWQKGAPDAIGTGPYSDAAASAQLSSSFSTAPLATLVDGPLKGGFGANWSSIAKANDWIEWHWSEPQEISSFVLYGQPGATLRSGRLEFSDGSTLALGAVTAHPELPTVLGFMPRVVQSVRLVLTDVDASQPLALAEIGIYRVGATPPAAPVAGPNRATGPASCSMNATVSGSDGLRVVCPFNGTSVGDEVELTVALGSGYTAVNSRFMAATGTRADAAPVSGISGGDGMFHMHLPTSELPAGPFMVQLVASGQSQPDKVVNLQLTREGTQPPDVASSTASSGRTLVWADEFHSPVSTSRTGAEAQYASGRPTGAGSAEDFGGAIFADPSEGLGNMTNLDGQFLAMNVLPRPVGYVDPQGWGREHVGALLASAHVGGSGVSAQYGYFEARLFAPSMPGTWPAFWLLPSDELSTKTTVGSEIDTVEMYGHDALGTCQTTHSYVDGKDSGGKVACGKRFISDEAAFAWHTYGVSVRPDLNIFYIDGVEVARLPQILGGASPMYFLVDLALGGGWPIELGPVQNRASLYVDYVRVYV